MTILSAFSPTDLSADVRETLNDVLATRPRPSIKVPLSDNVVVDNQSAIVAAVALAKASNGLFGVYLQRPSGAGAARHSNTIVFDYDYASLEVDPGLTLQLTKTSPTDPQGPDAGAATGVNGISMCSVLFAGKLTGPQGGRKYIQSPRFICNGGRAIVNGNGTNVAGYTYVVGSSGGHVAVSFNGTIDAYCEGIEAINGLTGGIGFAYSPAFRAVRCRGTSPVYDNGIYAFNNAEHIRPFSETDASTWCNGVMIDCEGINCPNHGLGAFGSVGVLILGGQVRGCGNNSQVAPAGPAGCVAFEYDLNTDPTNARAYRNRAIGTRVVDCFGFGARTNCRDVAFLDMEIENIKLPTALTATGSITGNTLNITAGGPLLVGMAISGPGVATVPETTRITADLGGGNYTVNNGGQTVASTTLNVGYAAETQWTIWGNGVFAQGAASDLMFTGRIKGAARKGIEFFGSRAKTVTASIAGATMTTSPVDTTLVVGQAVGGVGVAPRSRIIAVVGGGVYTLNIGGQAVASSTLNVGYFAGGQINNAHISGCLEGAIDGYGYSLITVGSECVFERNGSATDTAGSARVARFNNAGVNDGGGAFKLCGQMNDNYCQEAQWTGGGRAEVCNITGHNNGSAIASGFHALYQSGAQLLIAHDIILTNTNGKTARVLKADAGVRAVVNRASIKGDQSNANVPLVDIAPITTIVGEQPENFQPIGYAATVTPNPRNGHLAIGAMTGALSIANPSAAPSASGDKLTFTLLQDGTGGRAVSWGTAFKAVTLAASGTASQRARITFEYDAVTSTYVQVSTSGWYS